MSEEVSDQTAGDGDALSALLQAAASQTTDTPGQTRWDHLALLINDCEGAGAAAARVAAAEFEALDEAPADKDAARALALAILQLAASDDGFSSAFAVWRSAREPRLDAEDPVEGADEQATTETEQHSGRELQSGSGATKPGGEDGDSTRSFIERATFLATLLTMVFALLAIQWSFFRIFSLIALIAAGFAVWQSRLHRRSWRDRPVLISGLGCAVACIVLVVSTAVGLWDRSHPTDPVPIMQDRTMSAAISEKFYRIIFPIINGSANDQQIESVAILVSFWGQPCAELPLVQLYRLRDHVRVNSLREIVEGGVSVESGAAAKGLSVPVSGLINDGCTLNQLQLAFRPPGAELPRNSTTLLEIDIPKRLNFIYQSASSHFSASQVLGLPNVVNPLDGNFIAFHVIASISGSQRLGSCFVLTSSRPSVGAAPGTHSCNDLIGGVHAFWLETFHPKSANPGPFFKKVS